MALEDGSTVTANDAYLQESILNPNAELVYGFQPDIMPPYADQVSPEELQALIAYISSFK